MGTALVAFLPPPDGEAAEREILALIHHHGRKVAGWCLTSGHPDTIAQEREDLRFHAQRVGELVTLYLKPTASKLKKRRKKVRRKKK